MEVPPGNDPGVSASSTKGVVCHEGGVIPGLGELREDGVGLSDLIST